MTRSVPKNPRASSPVVRAVMRANRAMDTSPELIVRAGLRAHGLTGYRLHWKTPAGRVVIAFVGRMIAIEVFGCFWHRCPRCSRDLPKRHRKFWSAKFTATVLRDARKAKHLKSDGWRLFTIWECQTRRSDFQLPVALRRLISTSAAPPLG
jgi:DNA mismatch endonuclease (patch repair protein)